MVFGLFKSQPPLPETSIQWLFDAFGWCVNNFGSDGFYQRTILVTPSNRHFPGREESVEGMAWLIFNQVREYSGLSHWPCRLVDHNEADEDPGPSIQQLLKHSPDAPQAALTLFYEPRQVANPQAMIANYAHALAHHLGQLASTQPPCEPDQWLHMMEVLATYMGFGLILANTAKPVRSGGCGGCRPPGLDRSGYLSEYETSYALAIFCTLKGISAAEVKPHLKNTLWPFFKKAMKDVAQRSDAINQLKSANHEPGLRFISNTL